MIVRKYTTLEQACEAMRNLTALEVNYRVECRKASEVFSNMPTLHRTSIHFEWTISVTHEANEPRLDSPPEE